MEGSSEDFSDDRNAVAVHNGIIEKYQELKNKLARKGYSFHSDTDTEVAVKLIDYYYKKHDHTPVDAINHFNGSRYSIIRETEIYMVYMQYDF